MANAVYVRGDGEMTENEAIKAIKSNRPTSGYIILNEALGMSIKALEKQMKLNEMGDCYIIPKNGVFEVNGVDVNLAIQKQIPKKLIRRRATDDDVENELRDFITCKGEICRCPACGDCIAIYELKYCMECGQKLDWGESDEF